MIITCEQCDTRFQLDAAKIPARGARVRCSRCKHIFFVESPAASRDEQVDDRVEEALRPATAPEASHDLGQAEASDPFAETRVGLEPPGQAAALGPPDEPFAHQPDLASLAEDETMVAQATGEAQNWGGADEAWEFDDEPETRVIADAPSAELATPDPAFEPPSDEEGWDDPLDDGEAQADPESPEWFETGDAPQDGTQACVPADAEEYLDDPPAAEPEVETVVATAPVAPLAAPALAAAPQPTRVHAPLETLGWTALTLLLGLAVLVLARTTAPASARASLVPAVSLAGLAVADLDAVTLENLYVGPLLVISGRVEPTGAGTPPAFRVELVSASGEALASALAGPVVPDDALRELPPARVREAQALGGIGLGQPFQAIFANAPTGVAGVVLRAP